MNEVARDEIRQAVREQYARVAEGGDGCCSPSPGCCGESAPRADALAQAMGYSAEEAGLAPEGANMGLGCGNPQAIANLKPGETVLDLGSGGGFDSFLAAVQVGDAGRVIGVDMTPAMLSKARANAQAGGYRNVEFRLGEIEHLPVADASVDVVISNCVLNLSPDKAQVWREIARVLKPGGRVAISDLALVRDLPAAVREDVEALVGCVAGAVRLDDMRRMIAATGLKEIELVSKPQYIDAMTQWQDPLYKKILAGLPAGSKASDYITSVDVSARK